MNNVFNRIVYVCLCLYVGLVFLVHKVHSQSDAKSSLQKDVQIVRKRLRQHLNKTRGEYDLSDQEKRIEKMILDRSMPDQKVKRNVLKYLRQRYLKTLDSHLDQQIKSRYRRYEIRSKSGTNQSMLGLLYLVFRGGVGPLNEFMHLTNEPISTESVKNQLTVAGKWDDEKWKSVWYNKGLLKFHLSRISMADHLYYIHTIMKNDGNIPYGLNTLAELKKLKKWYGSKERFKRFVFYHPLNTFSWLQWKLSRIGVDHSKEEVIDMCINYAYQLIDKKKRKMFFRRISSDFSEELSDLLMRKLEQMGED